MCDAPCRDAMLRLGCRRLGCAGIRRCRLGVSCFILRVMGERMNLGQGGKGRGLGQTPAAIERPVVSNVVGIRVPIRLCAPTGDTGRGVRGCWRDGKKDKQYVCGNGVEYECTQLLTLNGPRIIFGRLKARAELNGTHRRWGGEVLTPCLIREFSFGSVLALAPPFPPPLRLLRTPLPPCSRRYPLLSSCP